jgi:hypothetical protein
MKRTSSPKILLSIALLFCTLLGANKVKAQSRQFDFEIRGGSTFCQIDGDNSGNYNKIGYFASVGTSMPLGDNERMRFVVEIGLNQKGSRIDNYNLNRNISLLYVEVPLMLAYDMLDNNQLRIGAGIAPAILAHAKVTTDYADDPLQSENYKRMDLLPICVNVRYRVSERLGIGVRWYNSLLNVAKENGSGTYRIFRSNKGQFNRLIQAGVTLNF